MAFFNVRPAGTDQERGTGGGEENAEQRTGLCRIRMMNRGMRWLLYDLETIPKSEGWVCQPEAS